MSFIEGRNFVKCQFALKRTLIGNIWPMNTTTITIIIVAYVGVHKWEMCYLSQDSMDHYVFHQLETFLL